MFHLRHSPGRRRALFPEPEPQTHRPSALRHAGESKVPLIGLIACFALGIALGALLISTRSRSPRPAAAPQGVVLSDQTRAVLERVKSPLTLRFYALLDMPNLPSNWKDYVQTVNALLGAYQEQTASNITIVRYDTLSDEAQNQASADGIKAFNQNKGAACYCGITLVQDGRSETLAHLDPEWAAALEFDLTRAIDKILTPPPAPPVSSETSSNLSLATEQITQAIPNLSTVTLEQGNQMLRDAALADFKATVAAGATAVKEAEDKVLQSQNGSEAEKQAALKQLQEVQAQQTQKLKDIAARLQNQLDALGQLKGTHAPAPGQQ